MAAIVHQLMGELRSSMGYTGCADIEQMRTKTHFVKITGAGMWSPTYTMCLLLKASNWVSSLGLAFSR